MTADEYLEKARVAFNNKNYEEAIDYCTKAIDLDPKNSDAYNNRGTTYYNLGKYNEAIKDYTKAIDLNPNDSGAYYNRGNAYRGLGKYDEGIKDYDEAIKLLVNLIGNNPHHVEICVAVYNNRGLTYNDKKEYDLAIKDYSKAIKLNPEYANAYSNRGDAYNDKKEYDLAIKDFDKAIELNSEYACTEPYNGRGNAYNDKKEYDLAIKDYDEAIRLNPRHKYAYSGRGITYNDKKEYDLAIKDFDKAIEINPEYADAYNNRGIAYSRKRKYDNAIKDFDEAIKLNPNNSHAYNNKGNAYNGKTEYDNAIKDFDEAIKFNPNLEVAYYNKSISYSMLEKYDEAINSIKELIKNCSHIPYNIYSALVFFYEKFKQKDVEEVIKGVIDKQGKAEIDENSLYSYVPFDKNAIDSIMHEYKYASEIFNFNDPTDPVIRLIKDYENTRELFNKVRIACFSTDPLNMLMYSHYTDRHKGICIKYNFSKFNNNEMALVKVEYEDKLNMDDNGYGLTISSTNKQSKDTSFLDLFATKHKNWEYESEYRIISFDKEKVTLPIKAIYLGKNMSDSDEELIKSIVNNLDKKIIIHKVSSNKDNLFELEVKEIGIDDETKLLEESK